MLHRLTVPEPLAQATCVSNEERLRIREVDMPPGARACDLDAEVLAAMARIVRGHHRRASRRAGRIGGAWR